MATFYPQLTSNESLIEQWNRYLRQKPLILNIENIVHDQTSKYKQMLSESSSLIRKDLNNSVEAVCETIESGFEIITEHLREISYDLKDIRYEMNAIASILDWGFTKTLEQQRVTNLLLGNISILLKIPDYQKERHDYIEKGLKFLKNSFYDPDMYDNALKYLLKAEELEPEDYFTLYRIGLIYLYSPNFNISKAEIFFRKSAKYAIVETNQGAIISKNLLNLNINAKFEEQIPEIDKIKIDAAEAYFLAARCCFLQNKFQEAAELANKAFILVPNMVEAGFLEAQALSANNEVSKSVEVLRTVIERDRFYSFKISRHKDLFSKIEIKHLIEEFRIIAYKKASDILKNCKDNLVPGSIVQDEINKIEYLVNKKSYLHSMKALDLLNIEKKIRFSDIQPDSDNLAQYNPNLNFHEASNFFQNLILKQNSIKFKHVDSELPEFRIKVNNLIQYLNKTTQWLFKLDEIIHDPTPHYYPSYSYTLYTNLNINPKEVNTSLSNFII